MKRHFFILLSLLACSLSIAAQAQGNNCPVITVIGPSGVTMGGDLMTFTASVSNSGSDKLGYEWTVSSGTIENGQGTAVINVRTTADMGGANVTAMVKIDGFLAGCADTASEIAGVAPTPIFCYFPFVINRANYRNTLLYVDNFLIELMNNPEAHGFMSIKLNERESRALKLALINRIYDVLVRRKAPVSRLTFAFKTGPFETEAEIGILPVELAKVKSDGSDLVINGAEYKQKINDIFKPNK